MKTACANLKGSLMLGALGYILLLFVSTNAYAKAVGGFNKDELKSIAPLLKRHGLVALCETQPNGSPKAMTLAVEVNAPREVVFKVFENPENFYYVSTLFKENKVLQKHDASKAYSWASRHKWFSFVGVNTVALFPPRRVDVSIEKSSIGSGKFSFLFYEIEKSKTIVVLSGILDVNSSEWLIRYLIGGNPSMRQAMNVAIGLVVLKGVKAMAERAARGKPVAKHRTRGQRRGPLKALSEKDLKAVEPLLSRGTVVLTDSVRKGRLSQATVIEQVNAPGPKFLLAAATPGYYPKMIKSISDVTVHTQTDKAVEFSWTFGFSIFGLTSRNRLTYAPDGVIIEGLDGNFPGALWRWQVADRGPNKCIVAYHGWANIAKTGYILEKSMKREPYLEHGFLAGSNMVMLRAIRRVVEGW